MSLNKPRMFSLGSKSKCELCDLVLVPLVLQLKIASAIKLLKCVICEAQVKNVLFRTKVEFHSQDT